MITVFALAFLNSNVNLPPKIDMVDFLSYAPRLTFAEPAIGISRLRLIFCPEGEFTGKLVVESNGTVLSEYPLTQVQKVGTMASLQFRTPAFIKLGTEDGERKITVVINESVVGEHKFNLSKQVAGSAYATNTTWQVHGLWHSHAYFSYNSESSDQKRINFYFFASSRDIGSEKSYEVTLAIKKNGKLVAKSLRPKYVNSVELLRHEIPIHLTNDQPLTLNDLAGQNGKYTVELIVAGKTWKTFHGEWKNGVFVPHPKSNIEQITAKEFLNERALGANGGGLSDFSYFWVTTS